MLGAYGLLPSDASPTDERSHWKLGSPQLRVRGSDEAQRPGALAGPVWAQRPLRGVADRVQQPRDRPPAADL